MKGLRGSLPPDPDRQENPVPGSIAREQLHARLSNGQPPVLVEALGVGFFADAHLPGAVNIPPGQVEALAAQLLPDPDAEIVVYCSGTCTSASVVARRLEELGYRAVTVYAGGKEDWVEQGLPLERSEVLDPQD